MKTVWNRSEYVSRSPKLTLYFQNGALFFVCFSLSYAYFFVSLPRRGNADCLKRIELPTALAAKTKISSIRKQRMEENEQDMNTERRRCKKSIIDIKNIKLRSTAKNLNDNFDFIAKIEKNRKILVYFTTHHDSQISLRWTHAVKSKIDLLIIKTKFF